MAGFEQRRFVEPGSERNVAAEERRFAGQRDEDILRHFFGESGVADPAQRGPINQVHVALDEALKSPFGAFLQIFAQQFLVTHPFSLSIYKLPQPPENRKVFCELGCSNTEEPKGARGVFNSAFELREFSGRR